MPDIAIKAQNLSKKYLLGGNRERYQTLTDTITNALSSPFKRSNNSGVSKGTPSDCQELWALKEISFEIHEGEAVGIIGRNGAGKSTLLKILSRITLPSEGCVEIRGRVGSLLEVGTGFHPELTGRENIFLNGTILGMKKRDIEDKFDQIVKYAEVERFLDTPVKRYSSGMYVRLAFAVAAHLEPEILLVDEVLAVGDAAFQKKCLGTMGSIASEGRTILYVSHNMTSIVKLCSSAIWLDKGIIRAIDDSQTIVQSYLASGVLATGACVKIKARGNAQDAYLSSVELRNGNDEVTSDFDISSQIKINISFCCTRTIQNFRVDVLISSFEGIPVFATTSQDYDSIDHVFGPGNYQIQMRIPGHFLASGEYYVSVNLCEVNAKNFDLRESILRFRVIGSPYKHERNLGFLVYPFEWQVIPQSEKK